MSIRQVCRKEYIEAFVRDDLFRNCSAAVPGPAQQQARSAQDRGLQRRKALVGDFISDFLAEDIHGAAVSAEIARSVPFRQRRPF